jgi:two-component system chemotaxis response regulator CheB
MDGDRKDRKIRVLVVDDSRLMNAQISKILEEDYAIEVVGRAIDGLEALEMIERVKPDVVTLDVEMPRMNGITALKHIMVKYAIPTVMISALTQEGAKATFDAFKYGAVDVIAKPSMLRDVSLEGQKADIIRKVKRAADIRTRASRYVRMAAQKPLLKVSPKGAADIKTRFIGIGAGTGGYYSLLRIISRLPGDFADVLLATIPAAPRYVSPFVLYLAELSPVPVRNMRDAKALERGVCYVGSSDEGPVITANTDSGVMLRFRPGASEPRKEGAIDRMLKSLAVAVGNRGVGVVLSGSGNDGAEGIAAIRKAGGVGVIQDITSCMDPSMPLAVLEKGSVEKILPDFLMADFLSNLD